MYDQLIDFLVENGERFSHEDRNGHIDSSTKIADHLSNLRDDYLKLIDNAFQQGEKFIELKNYKTENNDNVIKLMQDQESITLTDACGDEEILIEIFKKLLVDDYSPPSHNLLELYLHLFCAWLYFEIIKKINDLPLPMVMHMNYVSLRIITVVSFSLGLGPGINKKMDQRYKSLKPNIFNSGTLESEED